MSEKKDNKAMGRGLAHILGRDQEESSTFGFDDLLKRPEQIADATEQEISLAQIQPNPYQPRKTFHQEELEELADSIREHGVFQPILVKPMDVGYMLLAGERRVRAAKLAGLLTIPAIIKDFTEEQLIELSVLENIQREDLSAIEEAYSYQQMMDKLGYTQEKVADRVGKSRTHVTNILRLLNLPTEIQEMVNKKELTMGQVRPLVTVSPKAEQIRLATMIKNMDLSARQAEMLAKKNSNPKTPSRSMKEEDPDLLRIQKQLTSKFQTKVEVKEKEVVIHYKGVKDLNRILEKMNALDED